MFRTNQARWIFCLGLALYVNLGYAAAADTAKIRATLQEIFKNNVQHRAKFHETISKESLAQQTPMITSVMCSDSRVDSNIVIDTPVENMFVIRNIGNQIETAYGSVEYGVYHLNTELLLIIGHSGCGAVKAAMQDYSGESERIKMELDNLHVLPENSLNANIVKNVNNQVKLAVEDFSDKVASGEAVVIGMVYDLHNDFKLGDGALIVININNETNVKALANSDYMKGLKGVKFLN